MGTGFFYFLIFTFLQFECLIVDIEGYKTTAIRKITIKYGNR